MQLTPRIEKAFTELDALKRRMAVLKPTVESAKAQYDEIRAQYDELREGVGVLQMELLNAIDSSASVLITNGR